MVVEDEEGGKVKRGTIVALCIELSLEDWIGMMRGELDEKGSICTALELFNLDKHDHAP